MERLKRVAGVWSWLPAFRAVAETQHLPTASAELEVSASALSRTIRLLENDLGRTLFERQGRRIVLNEAGERLLIAVRDAMRRVHDGMSVMDSSELEGTLLVASSDCIADLVSTHAMAALSAHSPALVPHLRHLADAHVVEALLTGDIDVAFTSAPLEDPDVTRTTVGLVPMAVYAPRGLEVRRLADLPFVLWGQRSDGTTRDGWPPGVTRKAAATVSDLHAASALAQRVGALVVLPEPHGRRDAARGELTAVRSKVQSMPVYAFHRHTLLPGGRAETLVELATSAVAGGLQ